MSTQLVDRAWADGVSITLTPAGGLRLVGDKEAVARWTSTVRENKAGILTDLRAIEARFHSWVRCRLPADNRFLSDAWTKIERGIPQQLTLGERVALRAWVSDLITLLGAFSLADYAEARRFSCVLLASEDAWGINRDDVVGE